MPPAPVQGDVVCQARESCSWNELFFCYLTREHTHPNTLEHSFCYLLFLHTLTNTQPLFAVQRFFSGKLRPRAGAGQAAVAAESKTYTSFRAGKIVLSHYHYRGPSIASDFVAGLYFFIYKNIKKIQKKSNLILKYPELASC